MSTFDVRGNGVGIVDTIMFAETSNSYGSDICSIQKDKTNIMFNNSYGEEQACLEAKEIPNLILALQKALELGWTPKAKAPVKKVVTKKVPVVVKKTVKK